MVNNDRNSTSENQSQQQMRNLIRQELDELGSENRGSCFGGAFSVSQVSGSGPFSRVCQRRNETLGHGTGWMRACGRAFAETWVI